MKQSFEHLYRQARNTFTARYGASEASAMAFALLEDLYGAGRTDVLCGKDKEFSAEEQQKWQEILQKIAEGVPMQYAVGRALFCGRYFHVTSDTLIPRPETEALVCQIPSFADACSSEAVSPVRVLDCGTGSGCIAVSIALEHPEWEVEAWDISEGALRVASENARHLGAKVSFRQCDMLQPPTDDTRYHLIVSNPPYICEREASGMSAHVLDFEPPTALFVPDNDPLRFYRALAALGARSLVPGGCLFVETNRAYTQETAALFENCGFVDIDVLDDCFGVQRFVSGFKRQKSAG